MKIKKKFRDHFEEVIKIKKSPESIAAGFALGTFLAVLPTFGFGVAIGLLVLLIFKRVSKISLLIAFAVWNPLVLIPLYGLGYAIGDFLLKEVPVRTFRLEVLSNIYVYSRRILLGNFILAILFSLISYFIILKVTTYYKMKNFLDSLRV